MRVQGQTILYIETLSQNQKDILKNMLQLHRQTILETNAGLLCPKLLVFWLSVFQIAFLLGIPHFENYLGT